MCMDLNTYISSLEDEINTTQKKFFAAWNRNIRSQFCLAKTFDIRKYADVYGGFILDSCDYGNLAPALKLFFDPRVCTRQNVCLRGYDYYEADPVLNLMLSEKAYDDLWKIHRIKWEDFQLLDCFEFVNGNMSFENWVGTLGFLEYLFSELTSIQWFIFRNNEMILRLFDASYTGMKTAIEQLINLAGHAIACLLKYEFNEAHDLFQDIHTLLADSSDIKKLLYTDFRLIDKASMRAMREGDSLILIYAAYVMKILPFCKERGFKRIRLVSNAFGALNTGVIIKYLLSPDCLAEHTNILFAQHRTEGDEIYHDRMINECYYINGLGNNDTADAVFLVDDSICLGKSFIRIKEFLKAEHVFMLSLTLNCSGMRLYRGTITEEDDIEAIIHNAVNMSKEVNGTLPLFTSFWDFSYNVPEVAGSCDKNYLNAVYGSDMLLKHLWLRYMNEICQKTQVTVTNASMKLGIA